MSGKRSQKLRNEFEKNSGFLIIQRKDKLYKFNWRKFKREWRNK